MSEPRKFRFGAQVYKAPDGAAWMDKARKIADLGYSSLLMPDHFSDTLGPLVALTAAALAAPGLRIGTLVLDNDFRHPVELAKELATLDVVLRRTAGTRDRRWMDAVRLCDSLIDLCNKSGGNVV